jgi:hypothetical protein
MEIDGRFVRNEYEEIVYCAVLIVLNVTGSVVLKRKLDGQHSIASRKQKTPLKTLRESLQTPTFLTYKGSTGLRSSTVTSTITISLITESLTSLCRET